MLQTQRTLRSELAKIRQDALTEKLYLRASERRNRNMMVGIFILELIQTVAVLIFLRHR